MLMRYLSRHRALVHNHEHVASKRLAIRGVPRERLAISTAASRSIDTSKRRTSHDDFR